MPTEGLEPPHLSALDPKSSVSTNSTTWATWKSKSPVACLLPSRSKSSIFASGRGSSQMSQIKDLDICGTIPPRGQCEIRGRQRYALRCKWASGHGNTSSLRHITASPHHGITSSLHHFITASLHHCITPSLHHFITASLPHNLVSP